MDFMPPLKSHPVTGSEIETHRRAAGLSQAALSDILGVSAPTVNRWEKGDQEVPGPADKLLRMLIRGEMPLAAGLGAVVREDIGSVEMTVDAFEECLRRAREAGVGSVTEWIASLVSSRAYWQWEAGKSTLDVTLEGPRAVGANKKADQ